MKQIIAIIRIQMINQTKEALVAEGFPSFHVRKVLGRGKGNVDFRVLHGAKEGCQEAIAHLKDDGPLLVPKRMLSLIAPDEAIPKLLEAIMRVNKTGSAGDGKIFVLPVMDAVRIHTGETGVSALN